MEDRSTPSGAPHRERRTVPQTAGTRDRRSTPRGGPRRPPLVSVVIPTLNEARNLPHVFGALPEELHEIVLVDGGSTDDTVEVARRLRPDVVVPRGVLQGRRQFVSLHPAGGARAFAIMFGPAATSLGYARCFAGNTWEQAVPAAAAESRGLPASRGTG